MNIFSSSSIAKADGERKKYLKIVPLSQIMGFTAHDMSVLVLRGRKRLAIWVWLPLVLLVTPPTAEESLPQRMCNPFMVQELGCSGLGSTGIHKWKQSVLKITDQEKFP